MDFCHSDLSVAGSARRGWPSQRIACAWPYAGGNPEQRGTDSIHLRWAELLLVRRWLARTWLLLVRLCLSPRPRLGRRRRMAWLARRTWRRWNRAPGRASRNRATGWRSARLHRKARRWTSGWRPSRRRTSGRRTCGWRSPGRRSRSSLKSQRPQRSQCCGRFRSRDDPA
jgi:hypothetical protein